MHPNITKIIDQYLSGELSAEDAAAFEERLKSNPELQAEVELQQSINEGAARAAQRTNVQKIGKKYHFSKFLKWAGICSAVVAAAVTSYIMLTNTSDIDSIPQELINGMEKTAQIEELPTQYFQIPEEGAVVISEDGVLLSVPADAFLLNGQVYTGKSIVQLQEATDGGDIIKSGLSTMSGDQLLETQGMFGVQGFTEDGKPLDFNPEVGVYVQVPVDGYKEDMQLYDGKKLADGSIDWQDPEPLEKLPVPVDMSELDFYPVDYEAHLDEIKWKQDKKSRDSLYLSFEKYGMEIYGYWSESEMPPCSNRFEYPQEEIAMIYAASIEQEEFPTEEDLYSPYQWEEDTIPADEASAAAHADASFTDCIDHISPSKVLAFWTPKFNNTNLSTREFERRMRAIHSTCNDLVLEKYTQNLSKSISHIDKEVAAMGYREFERFASENVGALNPDNPHIKHLQEFYQTGIDKLKKNVYNIQKAEEDRRSKQDADMSNERMKERKRSIERENQAFNEEYNYNLDNVYKQLGYTKGFTIRGGSGNVSAPTVAIKNVDALVREATAKRESTTITDPITGRQAQLTYNAFNFQVENHEKYNKLFAYIFPHELNSYQRVTGTHGKFDYPLNNDILYDFAVVGITDEGYEYFQKQTLRSGELGTISLDIVSERKLEASIQQLNNKRNSNPMPIDEEMSWIVKERKHYKELKQRKKMDEFREAVACSLFPCYGLTEAMQPTADDENDGGGISFGLQ